MMAWLVDTIGPYPFEEYGVVVLPGFPPRWKRKLCPYLAVARRIRR